MEMFVIGMILFLIVLSFDIGRKWERMEWESRPTSRAPDVATLWVCECDWVNNADNVICVACGTPRR